MKTTRLATLFLALIMVFALVVPAAANSVPAAADASIAGVIDGLSLAADVSLVQAGDEIDFKTSFGQELNVNVAVLTYTFNADVFDYTGFTPNSVSVLDDLTEIGDGYVKLTVMKQDYNLKNFGSIKLRVKADAEITSAFESVYVDASYVIKQNEAKEAKSSRAYISVEMSQGWDLIDLSNVIDWFGVSKDDEDLAAVSGVGKVGWDTISRWDFNNNGVIDIYDITYVARRIGSYRPTADDSILKYVSKDDALQIVHDLSIGIGPRPGGTPNEDKAAEYIRQKFIDFGYEPEIQTFNVPSSISTRSLATLKIHNVEKFFGEVEFAGFPFGIQHCFGEENYWQGTAANNGFITGPDGKVTGEVVLCGEFYTPDFSNNKAAGKIALVRGAATGNASKVATDTTALVNQAAEAGAIGIIFYSTVPGSRGNYAQAPLAGITLNNVTTIPVVALANCHGDMLRDMIALEPVTMDINTEKFTNIVSHNVVATKPAKNNPDTAPVIVIGGHMDSVIGSPGGNDNATGVAYTLAAAKALANVNTDNVELRFIAFGCEESGLTGSTYYVNQLNSVQRLRIVGMYTADMMSPKEYDRTPYLAVMTPDGEPNIVTDSLLDAAKRLGYEGEVVRGKFPSSDHVPFYNAGIPSALCIRMGPEDPEQMINNSPANYTIERFYHTPMDNMQDNVDGDRMDLGCRLVTSAVYNLATKDYSAVQAQQQAQISSVVDGNVGNAGDGSYFTAPYISEITGSFYDEIQD